MKVINPYKMFQGAFIPNALMECKELSQSAKLMWARLAQYAGKDGRCFPRIKTLSEEIGLSESMGRKVIKELRDKGFIFVKVATGKDRLLNRPSEYFFIDNKVFHHSDMVRPGPPENGRSGLPKNGGSLDYPKMGGPTQEDQLRESDLTFDPEKIPGDGAEKKKKYHGTAEDHMLALKMYQAVLVVNATVREPNYDRWANDIRLMREQDGRTHADMWAVFDFANHDQFWGNNVLSPGALRRHYAKLAPRAGMVASTVRGASADVVDIADGKTCGQCMFAGQGRKLCDGDDADPDHRACDLFRDAKETV